MGPLLGLDKLPIFPMDGLLKEYERILIVTPLTPIEDAGGAGGAARALGAPMVVAWRRASAPPSGPE